MAVKDDDIVSMVLQAKREQEAILKQNESLRIRCHALETECEQLREESEGLHIGGHHHFRVPTSTGCRCQMMSVYPQPSALTEENLSKDELTSITLLQKLPSWHTSLARQDPVDAGADGVCHCVAVDNFHEGCRQRIEASKRLQEAVTELAAAREELAGTSSALAQALQEIRLLRQRLVGLWNEIHSLSREAKKHLAPYQGSKGHSCAGRTARPAMQLCMQSIDRSSPCQSSMSRRGHAQQVIRDRCARVAGYWALSTELAQSLS